MKPHPVLREALAPGRRTIVLGKRATGKTAFAKELLGLQHGRPMTVADAGGAASTSNTGFDGGITIFDDRMFDHGVAENAFAYMQDCSPTNGRTALLILQYPVRMRPNENDQGNNNRDLPADFVVLFSDRKFAKLRHKLFQNYVAPLGVFETYAAFSAAMNQLSGQDCIIIDAIDRAIYARDGVDGRVRPIAAHSSPRSRL